MRLLKLVTVLGVAIATLSSPFAEEQPKTAEPLTLRGAIEYALARYPALRAALEKKNAASASVGLSKTAYLPTANVLWQGNRATRNNIFGLLLQ